MPRKLGKWFVDYIKKRNGVDLTNVSGNNLWSEMNPFKYSIRLGGHVMKFIDQKHNKQKGDK